MEKFLSSPAEERGRALTIEPALVDSEQAAKILGICKRHFIALSDRGEIGPEPIRMGRRVLYSVSELRSWAAAGCPGRIAWQERKNGK